MIILNFAGLVPALLRLEAWTHRLPKPLNIAFRYWEVFSAFVGIVAALVTFFLVPLFVLGYVIAEVVL